MAVYRKEVRPSSVTQIALLQHFASQVMIAIENVRLFDEAQARTRESFGIPTTADRHGRRAESQQQLAGRAGACVPGAETRGPTHFRLRGAKRTVGTGSGDCGIITPQIGVAFREGIRAKPENLVADLTISKQLLL